MVVELSPEELEFHVALHRFSALSHTQTHRFLAKSANLSRVQFDILYALHLFSDGLRMHELADLCHLSRSRLTYQIGQLEKLGLVERANVNVSERAVVASITSDGLEKLRETQNLFFEYLRDHFFIHLAHGEMEYLAKMINRISDQIERD